MIKLIARKIKIELSKLDIIMSRRIISRIMKKNGLVSSYTVKHYKVHSDGTNRQKIDNILNQNFDNNIINDVVVSDLTYVNVKSKWHYICILIDLYNREIIGYSSGARKTALLVREAFMSSSIALNKIRLFHTDRGREFDNQVIDKILKIFDIERSLSNPGHPYDNAVAEATFKVFKTEFCNKIFDSPEQLKMKLFDYVN